MSDKPFDDEDQDDDVLEDDEDDPLHHEGGEIEPEEGSLRSRRDE